MNTRSSRGRLTSSESNLLAQMDALMSSLEKLKWGGTGERWLRSEIRKRLERRAERFHELISMGSGTSCQTSQMRGGVKAEPMVWRDGWTRSFSDEQLQKYIDDYKIVTIDGRPVSVESFRSMMGEKDLPTLRTFFKGVEY